MLKKTIEYNDLDGNKVTEDFYFHFSKAELAEMELSMGGGMRAYLQDIIGSENGGQIIATFKDILSKAYGRRSDDGKSFLKSPEISAHFLGTEAFSKLFMELVTDAQKSAEFITGVMPAEISDKMKDEPVRAFSEVQLPAEEKQGNRTAADYSYAELVAMPAHEFQQLVDPRNLKGQPQHVLAAAMQHRIVDGQ